MKSLSLVSTAAGLALMTVPGIALAQAMPGSEIVGQPVAVTTNGITNTVYLDPGGTARIMTPGGNTVAGNWSAANGQLCLNNGAAQECWPYASPVPGGTAGHPDQLLRLQLDLARLVDQFAAAARLEERARPLNQPIADEFAATPRAWPRTLCRAPRSTDRASGRGVAA